MLSSHSFGHTISCLACKVGVLYCFHRFSNTPTSEMIFYKPNFIDCSVLDKSRIEYAMSVKLVNPNLILNSSRTLISCARATLSVSYSHPSFHFRVLTAPPGKYANRICYFGVVFDPFLFKYPKTLSGMEWKALPTTSCTPSLFTVLAIHPNKIDSMKGEDKRNSCVINTDQDAWGLSSFPLRLSLWHSLVKTLPLNALNNCNFIPQRRFPILPYNYHSFRRLITSRIRPSTPDILHSKLFSKSHC